MARSYPAVPQAREVDRVRRGRILPDGLSDTGVGRGQSVIGTEIAPAISTVERVRDPGSAEITFRRDAPRFPVSCAAYNDLATTPRGPGVTLMNRGPGRAGGRTSPGRPRLRRKGRRGAAREGHRLELLRRVLTARTFDPNPGPRLTPARSGERAVPHHCRRTGSDRRGPRRVRLRRPRGPGAVRERREHGRGHGGVRSAAAGQGRAAGRRREVGWALTGDVPVRAERSAYRVRIDVVSVTPKNTKDFILQ